MINRSILIQSFREVEITKCELRYVKYSGGSIQPVHWSPWV